MNRSYQVLDGKLYSFLHEGRIVALDFENHEVHQSEVLLPPEGGARELRVHSFSLRDPQPSDGGFLLEGFFLMPHSLKGSPYAVPHNVYPATGRIILLTQAQNTHQVWHSVGPVRTLSSADIGGTPISGKALGILGKYLPLVFLCS